VSVDDVNEVDSSTVYLLLEHRKHSFRPHVSSFVSPLLRHPTHSEGFAGSMITASLDLSSTTR
jgi:hypothetical protein